MQWKRVALELDAFLGLDKWKSSPNYAYYDASLVRRVLKALREFRSKNDAEGVCAVLHVCVRDNFAGVESFRLYSESYYGTKDLVQEYLDEGERGAFPRSRLDGDIDRLTHVCPQSAARSSMFARRIRTPCPWKRRPSSSAQSPRISALRHCASLVEPVRRMLNGVRGLDQAHQVSLMQHSDITILESSGPSWTRICCPGS